MANIQINSEKRASLDNNFSFVEQFERYCCRQMAIHKKAPKGLHEPNDGVHAFPVVPYGVNVSRFLLSLGNRQSLNERIELLMCYAVREQIGGECFCIVHSW